MPLLCFFFRPAYVRLSVVSSPGCPRPRRLLVAPPAAIPPPNPPFFAPPLCLSFHFFRHWVPWASAFCAPDPHSFFFLSVVPVLESHPAVLLLCAVLFPLSVCFAVPYGAALCSLPLGSLCGTLVLPPPRPPPVVAPGVVRFPFVLLYGAAVWHGLFCVVSGGFGWLAVWYDVVLCCCCRAVPYRALFGAVCRRVWRCGTLLCAVVISLVLCCVVVRCVVWCAAALCCVVWLCRVVLLSPPLLLLPLLSGCALRPIMFCRVLLCAWCRARLWWLACVVLFGAGWARAVSGALGCGVLLCAVPFPLAFCGAVVLPCCVVWCVVMPCCPVLCPAVLYQGAKDTARAAQHIERAHRGTGAKGPRTPHTQHSTPSRQTGEQEPAGPGHRTRNTTNRVGAPVTRSQVAQDTARNTTHRAGTRVNRSQGAQDTAHPTQHTEQAHR